MNEPMNERIGGTAELVKAGAFIMSELLRVIAEENGEMLQKLEARLKAGEEPMLTFRVLPDQSGSVVELVTQLEGDVSLTRIAIMPILKKHGGTIN